MHLDFRTISVEGTLIFANLSLFTFVALSEKFRGQRYLRLWGLSFPLLLAGTLMISFRGLLPLIVSVLLSNLAVVAGYACLFEGMREFRGRRPWWRLDLALLLLVALVDVCFTLVWPSTLARVIVISLFAVYYYSASSLALLGKRQAWDSRLSILCAAFMGLIAALNVLRIVLSLRVGVPENLLDASDWDTLIQMLVSAAIVVIALAMLFLHALSLNHELVVAAGDREVLLREMAHRTKNDLSLVDSFISLEQSSMPSEELVGRLDMLRERIRCLAEAHDLLSKSAVSGQVRIDQYLDAIARGIARGGNVAIDQCFDEFELDFPLAVNLGLIMNELATNALKHAFPEGRGGRIGLRLVRGDATATLTVSDDGVGTVWPPEKEGLGMMIVGALVAKIEGRLDFASESGSTWRISFPLKSARP